MNWLGHIGGTLLLLSLIGYLLDIRCLEYVMLVLLSSILSPLPDLDLRLKIPHRIYTHNFFVVIALSIAIGYLTHVFFKNFIVGFLVIFLAFSSHILFDLLTYKPFRPLAPIQKRAIALRLVRASNRVVNNLLLILGIVSFSIYLIRIFI